MGPSHVGRAICEMSSFILKLRSLTWTSLTELDCYHVGQAQIGKTLRPSNWIQFDAHRVFEGMFAGVKYLPKSLERAMGMEDATVVLISVSSFWSIVTTRVSYVGWNCSRGSESAGTSLPCSFCTTTQCSNWRQIHCLVCPKKMMKAVVNGCAWGLRDSQGSPLNLGKF